MALLAVAVLAAALHAGQKRFHPVVLDAILAAECAVVDGRYYPYIVGFNDAVAKRFAKRRFRGMRFDGRIMYCPDRGSCVEAARRLLEAGHDNVDLGPFQINPRYHPGIPVDDLFDYPKARMHAWRILERLADRHGATWETLGRYHSARAERNRRYYMKLYRYIYGDKAR